MNRRTRHNPEWVSGRFGIIGVGYDCLVGYDIVECVGGFYITHGKLIRDRDTAITEAREKWGKNEPVAKQVFNMLFTSIENIGVKAGVEFPT